MIVLFEEDRASLLLSGVVYGEDGNIRFGDVINGLWRLEIRDGEFLAKSGNYIVNRRPAPDYEIVEIPKEVKGDYDEIMDWAQQEYNKQNESN